MLMRDEIKGAIEAILFVRTGRVGLDEIIDILEVPLFDVIDIMQEIMAEYNVPGKGLMIKEVNDGYVMCSNPEYSDYLVKMAEPQKNVSLLRLWKLWLSLPILSPSPGLRSKGFGVLNRNVLLLICWKKI